MCAYKKILNDPDGKQRLNDARENNTLKQLIISFDSSLHWFQDPWD